jgi:hypothetical protein
VNPHGSKGGCLQQVPICILGENQLQRNTYRVVQKKRGTLLHPILDFFYFGFLINIWKINLVNFFFKSVLSNHASPPTKSFFKSTLLSHVSPSGATYKGVTSMYMTRLTFTWTSAVTSIRSVSSHLSVPKISHLVWVTSPLCDSFSVKISKFVFLIIYHFSTTQNK